MTIQTENKTVTCFNIITEDNLVGLTIEGAKMTIKVFIWRKKPSMTHIRHR